MLELKYSLVIEATEDPNFFGFYSPDLEGFTGVGHSIEDCLYKARWGWKNTSLCSTSKSSRFLNRTPTRRSSCRTSGG